MEARIAVMKTIIGLAIVAASLASPSIASAQTAQAAQADRWKPWVGCWALTVEQTREGRGASQAAALTSTGPDADIIDDSQVPRTCVVRSGDGVTLTTTVPGQAPITQTVVADGSAHDITDGQCHGVEHTEWSTSGKRLFARAEMTCGSQLARTLTGIGLIGPTGEWVDIRTFRIDGRDATRVSRYHRVSGVATRMAPLGVDEIKEATKKVASSAVEAAVAETKPHFDMNKQLLRDLVDAQVPPNVIDVMVAVSYPDRFLIDEPSGSGPLAYLPPDAPLPPLFDSFDPFYPGSFYPAYYYSPFGYGYIGRYDPLLIGTGLYPGGVIVGGSGSDRPPASGAGRVINGQGYTRIRPAEGTAQPRAVARPNGTATIGNASAGSPSSSGSAPSSGSAGGGSSTSSSGGGGGGSASPQGYSGGGGGDTGRTAVPR
jgi:hypothetical protein